MTLTEEQRAAPKRVAAYMDEMYSVASPYHGCTEDANLLRAMIDSSGTVEPTGGFDLEAARAALVGALKPGGYHDQETARIIHTHMPSLLAEIERLRAENEEALESLTAAYLLGRHEKAQEVAARPKEGKIDSSEHVTEPTKMIGFDLEKARAEVATASACRFSESREQARIFCAEEILPDALDEIERLRGYEIAARDLSADLTKVAGDRDEHAARIKELEADLEQSEICIQARLDVIDQQAAKIRELEENCIYDPEDGKIFVPDGHPEIERLRARIKELEDAHKRAGAKYAKIIRELRSSVYANIPGLDVGKIGPDAETGNRDHVVGPDQMVPNGKVWQITEERKAAIDRGLQFLEWSYAKNSALDTKEQIAVLWAMLDEDTHDKP